MKHRSARQVVTFLLAVFVTVGLSLAPVQSGDMTVRMATAEMTASVDGNCQDCPDTGGDHGAQAPCPAAACAAPTLAVLPHVPTTAIAIVSAPSLPPSAPMSGRSALPDPHPPRPDVLV
ncbi:hypothetical protein [Chelativorans alearense]|uniref:hypothetical protein n=1 Tax=Chelativorans alearense TaxID=2681495 RepID=UPI0013D61EC4|nr:hypothetical protein [Chelativorans alearense]